MTKPTKADVEEVISLLGQPVLIGWPLRSKGTKQKWGHLTHAHMTSAYLKKLEGRNIGVALGRISGDIYTLDIDDDAESEEFASLNPQATQTLTTKGRKGCNFWWFIKGEPPPLQFLTKNGMPWGEWRGDGGQTIICGIHPDGMAYRYLNKVPPLCISTEGIKWPVGVIPPDKYKVKRTECTEITEITEENRSGITWVGDFKIQTIEEAIRISIPTASHQNHHLLFRFARALKTVEAFRGQLLTMEEKEQAFGEWHRSSLAFLRKDQSKDDYRFELLDAYENAEYPLGFDMIATAMAQADKRGVPEVALKFENPQIRRLVCLCRELQRLQGAAPFFISTRKAQEIFTLPSHTIAARWLKGLSNSGILEVVERGGPTTNKATRYRYLHPL